MKKEQYLKIIDVLSNSLVDKELTISCNQYEIERLKEQLIKLEEKMSREKND